MYYKAIVVLSAALALSLCAVGQSNAGDQPAPVAQAANSAPQSEPVSTAAYARTEYLKQAHVRGYKVHKKDGQDFYCRSEVLLGSRFEKQVCVSEDDLILKFKQEAEAQARAARPAPNTAKSTGQ